MVKIAKIGFNVDKSAGEVPFRIYSSNEPVKGNMFVVMSKITADTNVAFELYACDIESGEPTKRLERTTSMEKFLQSISILEVDLRKENPNVQMIHQVASEATGFALRKNGKVDTNIKLEDVMKHEKYEKLEELKKLTDAGQLDPIDLIVEIVKHRLFDPKDIAGMISILPFEKQIELAQKLTTDKDILANMSPEATAQHAKLTNSLMNVLGMAKETHDLLKGQTQPSNRISKFL